jgi:hypothetical protein
MNTTTVHRLPAGTVRRVTFDQTDKPLPEAVKVLPREARAVLQAASQHMPRSQRVTAINRAIIQVRRTFPQYFYEER